jgi:hypothetical protein
LRTSIVTAVVLTLLVSACQNDPDPTGIGLIPDGDLIGAFQFDSQQEGAEVLSSTVQKAIPGPTSAALSVGEAEGLSAYSLLRWFTISDTVGWKGRIVSASIRLHTQPYSIGDSAAALTLQVREITSFWSSFTVTYDSLDVPEGLKLSQEIVGSVSRSFTYPDSVDIDLDTTLVRKWLVMMNEGDYLSNYGIFIEAQGNNGIRAFQSAEAGSPPQLTIVMQTEFGLDTLRGGTLEDTYIVGGRDVTQDEGITVHGGIGARGKLHFDISAIPGANIVNYAKLYLTIDRSKSDGYYHGADSVIVYNVYEDGSEVLTGTGLLSHTDADNPDVLIAEGVTLTRAVQNWVNGKGNYGLLLSHVYEMSDINRLTFYGAEADSTRRPRLVVTYTSKP